MANNTIELISQGVPRGGRFFVEEGRLKEHAFWNNRFMDLLILAVYRKTWEEHLPAMRRRLDPGFNPSAA